MSRVIANTETIIDSRDVIERIEDLQDQMDSYESDLEDWKAEEPDEWGLDYDLWLKDEPQCPLDEEELDELKMLTKLAEQCEGYSDWEYGETLIHEKHFEDYCQELCEDIGDIPKNMPSYIVIDWASTADNLKVRIS